MHVQSFLTSRGCPKKKGEMCSHCDAILGKLFDGSYSYKPCDNHCCAKCDKLGTCKSACPLLADKAKQLKTDARAASRQAAEAKAEQDRPQIERITSYWKRFGEARALSGKTIKNWFKHCEMYYGDKSEAEYLQNEQGEKIKTDTTLPYGYNYFLSAAEKLRKAADYLGVSADYLLCRTDDPDNGKKQAQAEVSSAVWRTDADYPESKWLIVLFQLDKKAKPIKRFVYVVGKRLFFSDDVKTKVDMTPIAWMVFPEYKGEGGAINATFAEMGEDEQDGVQETG